MNKSLKHRGQGSRVLFITSLLAVPKRFNNIGIKHGFLCITIRQVPWEKLKTEAGSINIRQVPWEMLKTKTGGRGFQQLPRDLVNVNALKKPCSITIIT